MINIQLKKQKSKGSEYELVRAYSTGGYLTLQETIDELNKGEAVRIDHIKPYPPKINEYVVKILYIYYCQYGTMPFQMYAILPPSVKAFARGVLGEA